MIEKRLCYRREGRKIYIRTPKLEELKYTEKLWGDVDSMRDVGKTISFPQYKWDSFYKKMVSPTDGRNLYCLVFDYDDNPVGEASFHGYDSVTKTARLNVRIEASKRGLGYGSEAIQLILECFFYEFGGLYMLDTVYLEENRSKLEKIGFKIMYKNKEGYSYRLFKEDFKKQFKELNKKNFGIYIYEGMRLSTVINFLEILNDINKSLEKEVISVELIGENSDFIKEKNYDIKFKDLKSIKDVNLDAIIVPGSENNNFYEECNFKNLLENIKGCEIVCLIGNSAIPFIKGGFLRGLKAYYSKEWLDFFREENKYLTYSEEDIIDNGRFVMIKKKSFEIEGIKYIIKKMFGESLLERFDL